MVTNRESKSFGSRIAEVAQTSGTVDVFHPRSGISGHKSRTASACPNYY